MTGIKPVIKVLDERLITVIMVHYQDDWCQASHQVTQLDDWFDTGHQVRPLMAGIN
jgi:hypothetical protein